MVSVAAQRSSRSASNGANVRPGCSVLVCGRVLIYGLRREQADWLREAELKHCRVAMLATLGCIVQDVYKFPGAETVYSGDLKLTKLHDAAVAEGTMGQMLVWLSFLEIFGTAAAIQMLQVRPSPRSIDIYICMYIYIYIYTYI